MDWNGLSVANIMVDLEIVPLPEIIGTLEMPVAERHPWI